MAGHARPPPPGRIGRIGSQLRFRKPLAQHWLRTSHEVIDTKRLRNAVRAEQATFLFSSLGYDGCFHKSQKPTGGRNTRILAKNRPAVSPLPEGKLIPPIPLACYLSLAIRMWLYDLLNYRHNLATHSF